MVGRMGWSALRSELTLPALNGGNNPGSHCLCEGLPGSEVRLCHYHERQTALQTVAACHNPKPYPVLDR